MEFRCFPIKNRDKLLGKSQRSPSRHRQGRIRSAVARCAWRGAFQLPLGALLQREKMLSLNIGCLFILVATIVASVASTAPSLEENDRINNIKSTTERKNGFITEWTKILENPPDSLEVAVGSRVELQCEAGGFPPPQIFWITGSEPEREIQELVTPILEQSNFVSQGDTWNGISTISSTYVIDCASIEDQGLKYCVSVSKNAVATSSPTVLFVNTTRTTECNNNDTQPTIVLHTSCRFAMQQTTAILSCRAIGQPEPYLFWLDNLSHIISPTTHTRHTVLPNGDLQITNVKWSDMGEYVCEVQSGSTQKRASTFFYVIRADKNDKL